jgi:hypothetical protein
VSSAIIASSFVVAVLDDGTRGVVVVGAGAGAAAVAARPAAGAQAAMVAIAAAWDDVFKNSRRD